MGERIRVGQTSLSYGKTSSNVRGEPFLLVNKSSDRSRVRGAELGRGRGERDEEIECGPEELAEGVSTLRQSKRTCVHV
jgi:hypothetical protein